MISGVAQPPLTQGVFLPYQQEWVKDQSDVKIWEKSRRIGASWCEAADAVLTAAAKSGMDVWYIGYNRDMSMEFINDCAMWAKHFNHVASDVDEFFLEDEDDKDILTFRITLASGHRVTALSSRPNNLRGKQGKVIIDEAAFHGELEELIKAAIALLMWGGRVAILSTHDGVDNHFNELITEIKAGKLPYSRHKTTLEDALKAGLYKQICMVRGLIYSKAAEDKWKKQLYELYGNAAEEELDVVPRASSGAYYKASIIENIEVPGVPVVRLRLKDEFATLSDSERNQFIRDWCNDYLSFVKDLPSQKTFIGGDFARTADLTAFWAVQEDDGRNYPCRYVVELRNVPFLEQEYVYKFLANNSPRFTASALDAGGNGEYLAERGVQAYGDKVAAIKITTKFYEAIMPVVQQMMQDSETTVPKDSNIYDDLRSVELYSGVPKPSDKRRVGTDGFNRHGDTAVAQAMCMWAVKKMEHTAPISYESVNDESDDRKDSSGETWPENIRAS